MTESFFDELAHLAGQDPLQYRDKLLVDKPRLQRVLRRAGELAGWPGPSSNPNEGWGRSIQLP
jgi:isoquinoline 1-oxidoreductase beta subunit